MRLRWDLANEAHVTRHGVARAEIDDMIDLGFWIMAENPRGTPNRRLVIGLPGGGRLRLLTLVVQLLEAPGECVPVTCWPSTEREQALYWRRFR